MSSEELQNAAADLARIIKKVDTDDRGDVLLLASELLRNVHTQYFTAQCIETAARFYGVKRDLLKTDVET